MPISSAALAISTIALVESEQVKTTYCKSVVSTYDAKTATVAQMQEYSQCVSRLHPQEFSPDVVMALKVMFVLCLIGGFVSAWKEDSYGLSAKFADFFIGMLTTASVVIVIVGIVFGCVWVVS